MQLIYIPSLLNTNVLYTACQLSGITLLVPPFSLKAGRNQCQRQHKAPDNI